MRVGESETGKEKKPTGRYVIDVTVVEQWELNCLTLGALCLPSRIFWPWGKTLEHSSTGPAHGPVMLALPQFHTAPAGGLNRTPWLWRSFQSWKGGDAQHALESTLLAGTELPAAFGEIRVGIRHSLRGCDIGLRKHLLQSPPAALLSLLPICVLRRA